MTPGRTAFETLGHEGLQYVALDRKAHACMRHEPRGRACDAGADLFRADEAARGFDPEACAVLDAEAGDFAILDDVDAALVGGAGIAPGDGVMAHGAAAMLGEAALDRKAGIVDVEKRIACYDLRGGQKIGIGPVQHHGIAAPDEGVALRVGVDQVENPALADHGVVVQVLFQPFPELEREFIEGLIPVEQVVGADDGGVAPHVAAADPALFQHGDARLLEFLGQIIGRGKAMPAAADDDVIIG